MSEKHEFASLEDTVEYNLWRWKLSDDPDMLDGETEAQYLDRLQQGWAYVPSPFMREMERRMKARLNPPGEPDDQR